MSNGFEPIDPTLFNLAAKAVEEGLSKVRKLKEEKKYIGTYFNFPTMYHFENGIPHFSISSFSGPTNYKEAFGRRDDKLLRLDVIPSFVTLFNYIDYTDTVSSSRVRDYFSSSEPETQTETVTRTEPSLYRGLLDRLVTSMVDRYIHLHEDAPFTIEQLAAIYQPLESALFNEVLPVEIVIPILFIKFSFDSAAIADNASIERMSDDFQLARYTKGSNSMGINSTVLGAATHALVLNGWELKNRRFYEAFNAFYIASAYPTDQIDKFFTGVRIVTGASTGYAQLLLRPGGWAHDYEAHLPPVEGTSVRRYPIWFENHYWLTPQLPTLTTQQAIEIGRVFSKLQESEDKRLLIATQRLNLCLIRETEEDSILDATIAMEALLSDDERQEMTHKLALRMAALLSLSKSGQQTPVEVFRAVKQIYRYRSAVVHGSAKTTDKREIAISDREKIPTVTLAINYLRMAINILIDNPQYLKASKIDEELILGHTRRANDS
jgi:hypothetical protein